MDQTKKRIFSSVILAIFLFKSFEAYSFGCFGHNFIIELENGYRWDRIEQTAETVDSNFILPYSSYQLSFKSLQSYQLGATGRFIAQNFFFKLSGHYGWFYDGNFCSDRVERGSIEDSHSTDLLGGVGYCFQIKDYCWVSPAIGYSIDTVDLKVKDIFTIDSLHFSTDLTSAAFKETWRGPWIGIDVLFSSFLNSASLGFHGFLYEAGYEFHYGTSDAEWRPQTSSLLSSSFDGMDFTYKTKMKNMMGHVFHFDVNYYWCTHLFFGLGLKYTYWGNAHSKRTHLRSEDEILLSSGESQRVIQLSWHSFSAMLNLGYLF